MKYLNSLVFLGLIVMVSGCQKKEKAQPKKSGHHAAAHKHEDKKGSKKLEAKKPAAHKTEHKKSDMKKADHKKSAPKKAEHKKSEHKKAADMKN